jgi:uncharacterized membrane protein
MVGLGALDFNSNSNAQGVSRDGSTVVGFTSENACIGVRSDIQKSNNKIVCF